MSENYQKILQAKMAELMEVKEQLKEANHTTKQSFLVSKHVKAQLAELKSTLESARNRAYLSNAVISSLESQLEEMNMSIKSKMEEELKAKEMADEVTEALNETRKETEVIKWEKKVERSERSKLKQIIRMQKQKLRTLLVTLSAAEIESEAFVASTAEALSHIQKSETETETETDSFHELTQEEYYALIMKARDETALAEWRISLSTKQKLAAEVNQNLALSRLKELRQMKRKEKEKEKEKQINEDDKGIKDTEEREFRARIESQFNNGTNALKARARSTSWKRNRRQRKAKSKKKKSSILIQVRSFFVWSFRRFFQ